MLQHEEVLLLYDEKKSQKRDMTSPACGGVFDTSHSSEEELYDAVLREPVRVLQPCPEEQGYEGVHLPHLHLCSVQQECQGDEQVAKADDKPNEM